MNVLIISDTHGDDSGLAQILRTEGTNRFDVLIHAGDSEGADSFYEYWARTHAPGGFHVVSGNDYESMAPGEQVFPVDRYTVFLTHGHRFSIYTGTDLLAAAAKQHGAQIAVFGHTHEPLIRETPGLLLLNPGSLSRPRQEGHRRSYILLKIDDSDHSLHPEIRYL